MKIAVITAIFGGKDAPKPFPPQSVPCDYYCFTEENTPVPLPNLPDRLKAKYFKLQPHRVLPEYDYYVWIDGNIEVTSADFVAKITAGLFWDEIAIQRHHERQTIGEEALFVVGSTNPYLTTRYDNQPLWDEYQYYRSQGMPAEAPLFACNIFAYRMDHDRPAPHILDDWWGLCLEWSWFDQSAFSFLAWRLDREGVETIKPVDLGPMFTNQYFKLHHHAKPLG